MYININSEIIESQSFLPKIILFRLFCFEIFRLNVLQVPWDFSFSDTKFKLQP